METERLSISRFMGRFRQSDQPDCIGVKVLDERLSYLGANVGIAQPVDGSRYERSLTRYVQHHSITYELALLPLEARAA